MKIEWDTRAHALYINFREIKDGEVKLTETAYQTESVTINVDFDSNNNILGVEILEARMTRRDET